MSISVDSPVFNVNTENNDIRLAVEGDFTGTPLPRTITTVEDAPVPAVKNDKNKVVILKDIDGDTITVNYKGFGNLFIEGRSVQITGNTSEKDTISIKVNRPKGNKTNDGMADMASIESPAMKTIKMNGGGIDEINILTILNSVKIIGGDLGYINNSLLSKGVVASSELKTISVVSKKSKTKIIQGGNIYGDIFVKENTDKYKGANIQAMNRITANIEVPIIKKLASKKGSIVSSSILCTGEINKIFAKIDIANSYIEADIINNISANEKIQDVKIVARGVDLQKSISIGKISAGSIEDSQNNVSNQFSLHKTIVIAGLPHGNSESNLYNLTETTIGNIGSVKGKTKLEGLFISKRLDLGKKTKIKAGNKNDLSAREDHWIVNREYIYQWSGEQ